MISPYYNTTENKVQSKVRQFIIGIRWYYNTTENKVQSKEEELIVPYFLVTKPISLPKFFYLFILVLKYFPLLLSIGVIGSDVPEVPTLTTGSLPVVKLLTIRVTEVEVR